MKAGEPYTLSQGEAVHNMFKAAFFSGPSVSVEGHSLGWIKLQIPSNHRWQSTQCLPGDERLERAEFPPNACDGTEATDSSRGIPFYVDFFSVPPS